MKTFFECKAKFVATDEDGKEKNKSEQYLVNAVNFTDAESTTIKYLEENISGSSTVMAIKRSSIDEVVNVSDEGKYYLAKVRFVSIDEDSGKPKQATIQLLIQADTPNQTLDAVKEHTKDWVVDVQVVQVSESKIVDVVE